MDKQFEPKSPYTSGKISRKELGLRKSSEVEPLSDLLGSLGKSLNLDNKVKEWAVLSLWKQIVDPAYRDHTRAIKMMHPGINKSVLRVHTASSMVASELSFQQSDLLEKLNAYAPETGVTLTAIEIRVGRLDA